MRPISPEISSSALKNTSGNSLNPVNIAFATLLSFGTHTVHAGNSLFASDAQLGQATQASVVVTSNKKIETTKVSHADNRIKEIIWGNYLNHTKITSSTVVKTSGEVEEETRSLVNRILGFFLFKKNQPSNANQNSLPSNPLIDLYSLARASNEYLKENIEGYSNAFPRQKIIIAYSSKAHGSDGLVVLPLPIDNFDKKGGATITNGNTLYTVIPTQLNGYNTEHEIYDQNGHKIYQLSLLFPSVNPQELDLKKRIALLQTNIDELKREITNVEKGINKAEKNKKNSSSILHATKIKLAKKLTESRAELENLKQGVDATKPVYIPYTPYANHFNTKNIRLQGMEYLKKGMIDAYSGDTSDSSIGLSKSAITGLTIKEAIPYIFPLILNIVERMDFHKYFESDGETLKNSQVLEDLMIEQSGRALATFGLNLNDSFNYQRSRDGALGVGQVIKSTYELFRKHRDYGQFFSEANFVVAAKDHTTSFQIQILHLNDQIYQFPRIIQKNWSLLMNDEETRISLLALLAAGYNGSMKRIMDEVFPDKNIDNIEQVKKLMKPHTIQLAMKKARDEKVSILERKLTSLSRKLTPSQIKEINKEINNVNKTFKESSTYEMKARFMMRYINNEYPNSQK